MPQLGARSSQLPTRTQNCPTPKLFTCQISELRSFIGGKRRAPIVAGHSELQQQQSEQIYLFKRAWPWCTQFQMELAIPDVH